MNSVELKSPSKEIRQDHWGKILCYAATGVLLLLLLTMMYFVFSKGIRTFTVDGVKVWQFLTTSQWEPTSTTSKVGALALISTSFLTTILAAVIAAPLAIIIAIYVVVIDTKIGTKLIQPIVELLLGIPSVVYGFVGLTMLVPLIRRSFGGTGFGILAGMLILALMILPTITSLAIESLRGVDRSYWNFAYTLGGTTWQVITHVILKIAAPNLIIAVIYGIARAFGEALAVQMVIGNTIQMPINLLTPTATLTSKLTTDIGNTVAGTLANDALWSLALILLLMSLAFNLIAKRFAKRRVKS